MHWDKRWHPSKTLYLSIGEYWSLSRAWFSVVLNGSYMNMSIDTRDALDHFLLSYKLLHFYICQFMP